MVNGALMYNKPKYTNLKLAAAKAPVPKKRDSLTIEQASGKLPEKTSPKMEKASEKRPEPVPQTNKSPMTGEAAEKRAEEKVSQLPVPKETPDPSVVIANRSNVQITTF